MKKRNGDGTSFRTRGFGENLDDFWPGLESDEAELQLCDMSTFLLATFLTAETKGKFTCRRSDFSIFHVGFLDLYFDSILANHVESFFLGYFISNMLSLMFLSVTCKASTGPEDAN